MVLNKRLYPKDQHIINCLTKCLAQAIETAFKLRKPLYMLFYIHSLATENFTISKV